jgi:hypothetical protein
MRDRGERQRDCAAFHKQVLESFNLALGVSCQAMHLDSGSPKRELKCNPNTCPRSSGASRNVSTIVL